MCVRCGHLMCGEAELRACGGGGCDTGARLESGSPRQSDSVTWHGCLEGSRLGRIPALLLVGPRCTRRLPKAAADPPPGLTHSQLERADFFWGRVEYRNLVTSYHRRPCTMTRRTSGVMCSSGSATSGGNSAHDAARCWNSSCVRPRSLNLPAAGESGDSAARRRSKPRRRACFEGGKSLHAY